MSSRFNFRPKFDPKKYRWRPVREQHEQEVQLPLMKQQKKEQDSVVGTNAATITTDGAAVEEIAPQLQRLISFLEKDNSFLSPWTWDCMASEDGTSNNSTKGKQYLRFQPGSYFVREVNFLVSV